MKTKATAVTAASFLAGIKDDDVRKDSKTIAQIMSAATKSKAKMWGRNIVGFGERTIKYADGRETPWMLISFSPRKSNLTLYVGRQSPGKDKESNWLPAPDGTFSLYIRAYWGGKAILDGSWKPPMVSRIQ